MLTLRYRKPVWLTIAALIAIYLLGRLLYFATLPMDEWLTRGWWALRLAKYQEAEHCFVRAQRKNPRSDLPHFALYAGYSAEKGAKGSTPWAHLYRLPYLGPSLERADQRHAVQRQRAAAKGSARERKWLFVRYDSEIVESQLFRRFWGTYPRETTQTLHALRQTEVGRYPAAWAGFHALEQSSPAVYATLTTEVPLPKYYATVAWHLGKRQEAERILAGWTPRNGPLLMQHGVAVGTLGQVEKHILRRNIRLTPPGRPVPARVWSLADGRMHAGQWSAARWGRDQVVILPGQHGAHLFAILHDAAIDPGVRWWQWDGEEWRARGGAGCALLQTRLIRPPDAPWRTLAAPLSSAWSPAGEYLALNGASDVDERRLLLRIDGTARPVAGISPREIVMHGKDLWVREDVDFARIEPDGIVTEYAGRQVTQLGGLFSGEEQRPPLSIALHPAWRLARDGRGRLWFVTWQGRRLTLQVVLENQTFRRATAAEQAHATEGIVDTAERLWLNDELPRGFRRDAWRRVPGLPPAPGPAAYAVDARQRVWMISDGLAARWEGTRWVSVGNRLPGVCPRFTGLVAQGPGVCITLPGQVCYLD